MAGVRADDAVRRLDVRHSAGVQFRGERDQPVESVCHLVFDLEISPERGVVFERAAKRRGRGGIACVRGLFPSLAPRRRKSVASP